MSRARLFRHAILASSGAILFLLGIAVVPAFAQQAAPEPARQAITPTEPVTPTAPLTYTLAAAGGEHTCALAADGVVRCWGFNLMGQLGDDSNLSRNAPVELSVVLSNVVALEASSNGSMALTGDGQLWVWGRANPFSSSASPEPFAGLPGNVSAMSLSGSHFCALIGQDAFCYGLNSQGALGDGTTNITGAPVQVAGLDASIAQIAAGANFSCALLEAGDVWCWGANWAGALGNGTTERSPVPVAVRGLSGPATSVVAGDMFACAIMKSGGVECWGAMQYLQTTAIPISGLAKPVEQLSAGADAACAVSTGVVQCWGGNESGQLGVSPSDPIWQPVDVADLPAPALSVSVGDAHACAVLADGTLYCWGSDRRGQLGRNTQAERSVPVAVAQPLTVTQVAVGGTIYGGGSFTCALFGAEGALRCWGDNERGELGLGENIRSIGRPTLVPGLETGVLQVALGREHGCAAMSAGDLYCWGAGWRGQLGNGGYEHSFLPTRVSGLGSNAMGVIAGDLYTCVLLEDGSVRCWGDIVPGIDNGSATEYSAIPITPPGLESGVVQLVGGGRHACATMEMGDVLCWGQNNFAQVGSGQQDEGLVAPTPLPFAETPVSVALGEVFSCALLANDEVQCWGRDSDLWITRSSQTLNVLTPTVVSNLPDGIQNIVAGAQTFCTLSEQGGLACVGDDTLSELGRGEEQGFLVQALPVTGLEAGVVAVALGESHSCTILEGGALWCWGSDGDGELGLGTKAVTAAPGLVGTERLPSAMLNSTTAAPGSILSLAGFSFPSTEAIDLLANGVSLSATTALTTNLAGAVALYVDTTGAESGYYVLTLMVGGAPTATKAITTSLDLILTNTAPLLAQQGGGLATVALSAAPPLDPALAPQTQQVILLAIKEGANIRQQPNGDVLRAAEAGMQLAYDAATAGTIPEPVEVNVAGDEDEYVLIGQSAGQYTWVPVLVEGETAWVGTIVIVGASEE